MNQPQLSTEDLEFGRIFAEVVHAAETFEDRNRREHAMRWYDWQEELFGRGLHFSDRMTLAGNQTGKTESHTYEFACHITGDYDAYERTQGEKWQGLRMDYPGNYWGLGLDNRELKRVVQRKLLGELTEGGFTGGWIHPDEVISYTRAQEPGLAKDVLIRHKTGGKSSLSLRAYTQSKTGQGSLSFAAETVDGILVDEQPPDELIGQLAVRRLHGRRGQGGFIMYGMTPERGLTELVHQFMENPGSSQCLIGPIDWDQCPHLTQSVKDKILEAVPDHEKEMRKSGIPLFGEGRLYTQPESDIVIPDFRIADYPWFRVIRAIDLGIGHPFGGAWLAYDPDEDVTILCKVWRKKGEVPAVHMAMMNSMWQNSPIVVPHDIDSQEKSGKVVRHLYEEAGMTEAINFTNPGDKESNYVWPGIVAIQNAERLGKFKVMANCTEYLEERRIYHLMNNKIVKERDDLMDAVRYGYQMVKQHGVPFENIGKFSQSGLYPATGLQRDVSEYGRGTSERSLRRDFMGR